MRFAALLAASLGLIFVCATVVAAQSPLPYPTGMVEPEGLPLRVYAAENFETDIESRWWLRGEVAADNVPPGVSRLPNRRACRATQTNDFEDRQGNPAQQYKAVVFNPVPGPPVGENTRLSFRYFLTGTSTLRVQIFSLTNEYHRGLVLTGLPQGRWQSATVDMTLARRPDGDGGPLSADERIDDIQFYIPTEGELLIDDIVLYEAARSGEHRPFPSQVVFTGWFDTGDQGAEWPGKFEIVPHESPRTWKAARSLPVEGGAVVRVGLRGVRPLPPQTRVRFAYKLNRAGPLWVELASGDGEPVFIDVIERPEVGEWSQAELELDTPATSPHQPALARELVFSSPAGELHIDDLLIYAAGVPAGLTTDYDWVTPMRKVHERFTGRPGTVANFGDSITISMAYWAPLARELPGAGPNLAAAAERVKARILPECWRDWKGPEFGNQGGMTSRWAHENLDDWLTRLNPEVAIIMFGTNDLHQLGAEEYERLMDGVVRRTLEHGTVAILTTIPPHSGRLEQAAEYAAIVRRIARRHETPSIDYFQQVIDRRPDDWDGTLPAFAAEPHAAANEYEVPTPISRDGVHPSFPATWQGDFSGEGLYRSGYTLRSYLSLLAYAEVIDRVLNVAQSRRAGTER